MKRVLVTAGATMVPIDKVRAITNIFKGRTGTAIAEFFSEKGYEVILLTSNPELLKKGSNVCFEQFKTYWELYELMSKHIKGESGIQKPDIIVHSAAVSDYEIDGVCVKDKNTDTLVTLDRTKKVDSSHQELFLKLTQTPKIIDLIKNDWGFTGQLVKFKLQVGITDIELLEIAIKSMIHSKADIIVANCLEWSKERAYVVDAGGAVTEDVERERLPEALWRRLVR